MSRFDKQTSKFTGRVPVGRSADAVSASTEALLRDMMSKSKLSATQVGNWGGQWRTHVCVYAMQYTG
jgi:hypothetical protein